MSSLRSRMTVVSGLRARDRVSRYAAALALAAVLFSWAPATAAADPTYVAIGDSFTARSSDPGGRRGSAGLDA